MNAVQREFENRELRRIFVPATEEVIEGRRKLHNEELHNLYYSPNSMTMIKPRWIRCGRHVADIEKNIQNFCHKTGSEETSWENEV
jgi:hypothetical protein